MSTTPVSNILHRTLNKRDKLNILCFFFDGRFEDVLVKTGHNIYGAENSFISNCDRNPNLRYLPDNISQVEQDMCWDLILYNHEESQFNNARKMSAILHVPALRVEHFLSATNIPTEITEDTVFSHSVVKNSYKADGEIIRYGIEDSGESEEERDIDVLIHGNFIPSDYQAVRFIEGLDYNVEVWGDSPGLSEQISNEDLVSKLKKTKVFINLSTQGGVPYSALVAMMSGCAIISNKTEATEGVFTDDFAILVKTLEDFDVSLNHILSTDWKNMGKAARKVALENFNIETNAKLWDKKLRQKSEEVYIR